MNYQQLLDYARDKYKTDPGNRRMWVSFGKAIKSKMIEKRLTIEEVEEAIC